MAEYSWVLAGLLFSVRLGSLRRFWKVPDKFGEDRLFIVEVPAGSADRAAALRRRYRAWLFAPFGPDAIAIGLLVSSGRSEGLLIEQFVAMVLALVFHYVVLTHFWQRSKALSSAASEDAPSRVLVSLERRRLRDHTSW